MRKITLLLVFIYSSAIGQNEDLQFKIITIVDEINKIGATHNKRIGVENSTNPIGFEFERDTFKKQLVIAYARQDGAVRDTHFIYKQIIPVSDIAEIKLSSTDYSGNLKFLSNKLQDVFWDFNYSAEGGFTEKITRTHLSVYTCIGNSKCRFLLEKLKGLLLPLIEHNEGFMLDTDCPKPQILLKSFALQNERLKYPAQLKSNKLTEDCIRDILKSKLRKAWDERRLENFFGYIHISKEGVSLDIILPSEVYLNSEDGRKEITTLGLISEESLLEGKRKYNFLSADELNILRNEILKLDWTPAKCKNKAVDVFEYFRL